MIKTFLLVVFILLAVTSTGAQQSASGTASLSNIDVVEMVKAGLSLEVIKAKIQTAKGNFDTSTEALQKLKADGVPDEIVVVMVAKSAASAITSTWDEPEHGDLSEVKNARKVIIFTEDLNARKIIIKELEQIPDIQVVDNKEDADFGIAFRMGSSRTGASVIGSTVTSNYIYVGEMLVITPGKVDAQNRRHQRILWSTRKKQDFSGGFTLNRHPATNAIREFISAFKKIRSNK